MGCADSRAANLRRVNLWESKSPTHKNKVNVTVEEEPRRVGSRPRKEQVLTRDTRRGKKVKLDDLWGRAVSNSPIMDQEKFEIRGNHQKIVRLSLGALKVDSDLSETISLSEIREITQLKDTSGSMNLNNIYEAGYVDPSRFELGTVKQSYFKIPQAAIADTICQYSLDSLAQCANRSFSYNPLGIPVLMGQKPEVKDSAIWRQKTNDHDHENKMVRTNVVSGHLDGPYDTSGNSRHGSIFFESQKLLREYQPKSEVVEMDNFSSKSKETESSKYLEVSPDIEDTVIEHDSIMDIDPYGLGTKWSSKLLTIFSEDSVSVSNEERTEDLSKATGSSEENTEYLLNEFSTALASSNSVLDLPIITKTDRLKEAADEVIDSKRVIYSCVPI